MKQTNYINFFSTKWRSNLIALLLLIFGATSISAQCDGTTIAFKWGSGTVYNYTYNGIVNGKCSYKQMSPGTSISWSGTQWNIYGNNQFTGTIFWHSTKDIGDRPSGNINDWVADANILMISFTGTGTVLADAPTVTTEAVTPLTSTSATGNGTITAIGFDNPTAHGICWNTAGSPTIADNKIDKGPTSTIGAFTAEMTGLSAGVTYKVRAFATNSGGTSYGEERTFSITLTSLSNNAANNFTAFCIDGNKIAISGVDKVEVGVYNQLGQQLFFGNTVNGLINSSLTKGVYLVKVNGKVTKVLVK